MPCDIRNDGRKDGDVNDENRSGDASHAAGHYDEKFGARKPG